jgi:hypothetical protein
MAKEKALKLDAQDLPLDAAQAYEEAVAASEADFETFMNLAVLYFVCTDGGYAVMNLDYGHWRAENQFEGEEIRGG